MNHKYAIEAILFAVGSPVELKNIANAIEMSEELTYQLILQLKDDYVKNERGFNIIESDNKFQMCTSSEYYDVVKKLYEKPQKNELTPTMMETLAIIAYKQPITKAEIDEIRGVSSISPVNNLLEFGLIEEKGRLEQLGRPIILGTTDEFLKYFGITSMEEFANISLEVGQN